MAAGEGSIAPFLELPGYEILRAIGSGGMGEVWLARHRLLGRRAAIKLLNRAVVSGEGARERFALEAQSTAALRTHHVVEVYDFGVSNDGRFYYVMELLNGVDLHRLVESFGPLPPERVLFLLLQICEALAETHRHGLIHHDVKPANIMITKRGAEYDLIKILDFGLVRTIGCDRDQIATPRRVAGTPAFIAPEILLSECVGECNVDGRADIYSLGCTAYWLLTGQLVFAGATPEELCRAHLEQKPTPPSRRTELDVPEHLDEVLMACLEKDPDRRPQTTEGLATELAKVPGAGEWNMVHAKRWWELHAPSGDVWAAGDTSHARAL